jgi:asparagine synthase (glutamine-hydrolysing)
MCGISGIWIGTDLAAGQRVSDMLDTIVHRGPDGDGRLVRPGLAMGMRRLAIIDLAGGDQPIYNEDRSVGIVFNGEIYNFRELRADLERQGHRFTTRADTETLVHGYEHWGANMLHRLVGMFAFALWDERRRRLLVARDRLGKKPLYYCACTMARRCRPHSPRPPMPSRT